MTYYFYSTLLHIQFEIFPCETDLTKCIAGWVYAHHLCNREKLITEYSCICIGFNPWEAFTANIRASMSMPGHP